MQSGGFEALEVMPGSLDLVTLNHVLEHLADPWGALRLAHRWLAGDGLLFLEVPDLASARKQASNLFHTAHIWNFTPETLALLAWQCGFAVTAGSGTSLVLRKRRAEDPRPAGADAALAGRLLRLVTTEARPLAYLLSGSPVRRRVARLRRNIDEYLVCRRHAGIRDMADDVIASTRSAQ